MRRNTDFIVVIKTSFRDGVNSIYQWRMENMPTHPKWKGKFRFQSDPRQSDNTHTKTKDKTNSNIRKQIKQRKYVQEKNDNIIYQNFNIFINICMS